MPEVQSTEELGGAGVSAPVSLGERIVAIDTLRGVAVLGILVMNIYAFAMPFIAYMNPTVMGGLEWYNIGTWIVTHIFFDQKFMTIFSMLFGAGLVVMWQRAEARKAKFGRIYFRRQFWLLLIGAAHGYLLWMGDILFHYALMGMFVYLFRKRQPRTLIIVGCALLPVALLATYGGALFMEQMQGEMTQIEQVLEEGEELTEEQNRIKEQWDASRPFMAPTDEDLRKDVDAYRGDYAGILEFRAPVVASMQIQNTFAYILWRVGGLMLIGMAFMKLGILSGDRDAIFYKRMLAIGYGFGLPVMFFSAYDLYSHQFDSMHLFRTGMISNYVGSLFVALGHIAAVMLIVKAGMLSGLMARFSAVGRMALTNYLLHSIILTTVFYGYGFGLYGEVPRLTQMLFVVLVIGFQMIFSPWWLSRYRFGPAEWLWRSLTYWKRQPMRVVT